MVWNDWLVVTCNCVAAKPGLATSAFTLGNFRESRSRNSSDNIALANLVWPYLCHAGPAENMPDSPGMSPSSGFGNDMRPVTRCALGSP